jgi:hypothetical protein
VIDESHLSYKSGTCRICKKCKQILDFTNVHLSTFEKERVSMTCDASANNEIWNNGYGAYYVPKSACKNGTVRTTKIESTKQSHGHTSDNTDVIGTVENNENCSQCKGSSIDQSKLKAKIKTLPDYEVIPGYKNL